MIDKNGNPALGESEMHIRSLNDIFKKDMDVISEENRRVLNQIFD